MTAKDAADRLGVSRTTVYDLCRARKLGHSRVGAGRGAVRISESDLAAFEARARVEPAAEKAARSACDRPPQPRRVPAGEPVRLRHFRRA